MSDSSRRIPPPVGKKFARMQSQEDRDAEGLAARREREGAVKDLYNEEDEVTGRHEGEELEALRARRPDSERIRRLDKKSDTLKRDIEELKRNHDDLKQDVSEVRSDVGEVRSDVKDLANQVGDVRSIASGAVGKLEGQEGILHEMLSIVKKTAERDHVTFTAKVEVDKEKELARVEVDKEQLLAGIEVAKEEKVDVVKAKRDRRKLNIKFLGLIAAVFTGGAAVVEILHQIGVL